MELEDTENTKEIQSQEKKGVRGDKRVWGELGIKGVGKTRGVGGDKKVRETEDSGDMWSTV